MKAIPRMTLTRSSRLALSDRQWKGEDAPPQRSEGAFDAWLEIEPCFANGLLGMEVGHELIVITSLHEPKRDVLKRQSAQ
jgi:tRNA (Thr-GGU) A37 N-methylase